MGEYVNPAKIFGENVFNDTVMQERLPKNVYKKLKKIIEEGGELDLATADTIAHEMKEWAIEKGATHYTLVPAADRCNCRKARFFYHSTDAERQSTDELLR